MANGKIKNTTSSELKPVIINPNTINNEAIKLRDAKKPFVVEKRPISASAKIGRPIKGARNTLSRLRCHENIGARPAAILPKNCPAWKSLANNSSMMVAGLLKILIPSAVNPANMIIDTIIRGNLGNLFTIKRKCGCINTKPIQNIAKYIIYGVKIDRSIAIANKKQYIGRGRFSP
jgi:hypothetical protein